MRPPVPTHPEDDRLLELAYGEMPASEARTLRQHVEGCARCRGVLDGIAEVRSAFRSVPSEPAPERGLESLLAYGAQAAERARSRRGGLRILGLLSAAAALAVVWLVLPVSHKEAEGVARAPESRSTDRLARLDKPQASPEQGNGVRDETNREKAMTPPSPAATEQRVAQKERPKMEEQTQPGRRAANLADADAKRKDIAKLDAESKASADAPAELRAEAPKDRAAGAAGLLGAGAGPSSVTSGGAVASTGAMGLKKSVGAEHAGADAFHQAPAASPPPSVARADDIRAQDAAKVAAAPVGEALASSDRVQPQPSKPLAKAAAPSAPKGAGNAAEPASRSIQMQAARAGMGTADQQARLAEIARKLETARGDERKALLLERCELEAKMERRPDAVLSCSQVAKEFPGTPEAARASEIARGFSMQLPAQTPER
jgi:hypothetical protein